MLSRKLVTLKEDVPVEDNIENLLIKDLEKDKLYNFLREMEFNRLLSQAISFYGESTSKINDVNKKIKKEKIDLKKYETITEEQQLDKWISVLKDKSLISVDTETTSLYPTEADLVGISFCYAPNHACYIP